MTLSLSNLRQRIEALERQQEAERARILTPFLRALTNDDLRLLASGAHGERAAWLTWLYRLIAIDGYSNRAIKLYRSGKVTISLTSLRQRIEKLEQREASRIILIHYPDEGEGKVFTNDGRQVDSSLLNHPGAVILRVVYNDCVVLNGLGASNKSVVLPLKTEQQEPEPVEQQEPVEPATVEPEIVEPVELELIEPETQEDEPIEVSDSEYVPRYQPRKREKRTGLQPSDYRRSVW